MSSGGKASATANDEIERERKHTIETDPFTLSVWINCAIWRFLIQLLVLIQMIIIEFFGLIMLGLTTLWKRIVSAFAKQHRDLFTPATVKKIVRVKQGVPGVGNDTPAPPPD
jgi:hypothetical protein